MSNPAHALAGRFIVLEGLDGAGTTTQTQLLHDYFTQNETTSFATFEPTDGLIGRTIRELLSTTATSDADRPHERELGLLFAADRLAHSRWVRRHTTTGGVVVCDRYVLSSMAYQSATGAVSANWVVEVNDGCAVPDVTVFVDVPVEECLRRLATRRSDTSIYEKQSVLEKIDSAYRSLFDLYRRHFGKVVVVDGTGSPEEVRDAIIAALLPVASD